MTRIALFFALLFASLQPVQANDMTVWHASYYGERFHGRLMANGQPFDMNRLTAAHRTLPFGTRVAVSYNNRNVIVTITDRGPFIRGRDIDLSRAAAAQLGLIQRGHGPVQVRILT